MEQDASARPLLPSDAKASVCFVALENFAALVDDPQYGRIGGAEIQQTILGRNLAKRGYKVSFITLDHGQSNHMTLDGMRILKAYDQNAGVRGLRFLHPRLTGLWRAMKIADADIYYQRTRDSITGIVAAFCQRHRKKFVFAVAHDYNCMTKPPSPLTWHARVLYHYGLRRADLVIAQTASQQRLLRDNFGLDSTVISNCAPDAGDRADVAASTRGRRLLWVGAFSPAKRLELLLDIAEQLHDCQFDVVGDAASPSKYVQGLRSRAMAMANVHLHGAIPHYRVLELYRQSAALVCTSQAEGFPNIFLEAWSHGLPVVSTFDPDNQIARHHLGAVAHDLPGFVERIRTLLGSERLWQGVSEGVVHHYREYHSVEAVLPRLEDSIERVLESSRPHGVHPRPLRQDSGPMPEPYEADEPNRLRLPSDRQIGP